LGDLQELHWAQPAGAPRALLHAYVSCARIPAGDLPHDCERSLGPHRLLVCILKGHSPASVYAELECRAVMRPMASGARPSPQTMIPLRTA